MFFLLFKRSNKEKTLKVIFYYISYCILNEIVVYYLYEAHKSDYLAFALFTILEFSFFCIFFYYAISTKIKKAIPIIWGAFLLFSIIDFFFVDEMDAYGSFAVGVEYIFIILMCIYYLVVQIKGVNNLSVYSTSNFWIIITFLIYTSGTFFLYIMAEKMLQNKAFRVQYIIINSVFNILKNLLLSIAMLMKSTPENNQSRKNKDWDDLLSYKLKN